MGGKPAAADSSGDSYATPSNMVFLDAHDDVADTMRMILVPRRENMTPLAIGAGVVAGLVVGATVAGLASQRREVVEGGRTVYYEPDRIIISDPSGQQFVRGNDL